MILPSVFRCDFRKESLRHVPCAGRFSRPGHLAHTVVYSRASVLQTLFTAQTRLVLQTATYRRQERRKHAVIAAAALKTPTRNGYNAQGVNLTT